MAFITLLLSAVFVLVLAWSTSLYYLFLYWRKPAGKKEAATAPAQEVFFHVIVPCFEEAGLIAEKLANLGRLDYPAHLFRVYVVDGGSTDGTAKIARAHCREWANFEAIVSPRRGKIAQVNHVLEKIKNGIVMITDVDGLLEPAALGELSRLYLDPDVGCVGANVLPDNPLPEDAVFWRDQNAMRRLESEWGHSSVMVAAAYSFRRDLFERFPADVVADDVYAAFTANLMGKKCLYPSRPRVREVRSGTSAAWMFRHKLRKINANMLELRRFLPAWRRMRPPCRMIFVTKFIQSWLAAPMTVLLAVLLVISFRQLGAAASFFWLAAAVVLLTTSVLVGSLFVAVTPEQDRVNIPAAARLRYFLIMHGVLLAGFFRYFLVRQHSSYLKVK